VTFRFTTALATACAPSEAIRRHTASWPFEASAAPRCAAFRGLAPPAGAELGRGSGRRRFDRRRAQTAPRRTYMNANANHESGDEDV
jgi:hypothetical protein